MAPPCIVVFEELLTQYPGVRDAIERAGAACVGVKTGREALDQWQTRNPACLILDVAMPQMSGIECCRQIKEAVVGSPPRIVLVSSLESGDLESRAEDAGCDRYLKAAGAESELAALLADVFGGRASPAGTPSASAESAGDPVPAAQPPVERRTAPRLAIPGPVRYMIGEELYPGESINLSANGILFAAAQDIPVGTQIRLLFRATGNFEFDLPAKVVRTLPLKQARQNLGFGIGAGFLPVTAEDRERLDWLLENRLELKLPHLTAEYVRKIVDAGPDLLQPLIRGQSAEPELAAVAGRVTPFEVRAFQAEGPMEACVRRQVLLRAQFRALRAFTPSVAKNPGTLGPVFVPIMTRKLQEAAALEEESNEFVRQAVEAEAEEVRQGLNGTANALFDAKVQMLYGVHEKMRAEGLGSEGAAVQDMHARAEQLKSLQAGQEVDLKYARRAPPPPLKKEGKVKEVSGRSLRRVIVLAAVFVLLVGGGGVWRWLSGGVSSGTLALGVETKRAVKSEDGIELYLVRSSWSSLPDDQLEEVFVKLEAYMQSKRLKQAKIFDENDALLAVIMGSSMGRKLVYSRRLLAR